MAIIEDRYIEKFGCLRFDKRPDWFPWACNMVFVAELSDGTFVAGPKKSYQSWLESRKRNNP